MAYIEGLGFGGKDEFLSLEEETQKLEIMALKMKALLEEAGWFSSFGQDPLLILIEYEEYIDDIDDGDDNVKPD